MQRRLFCMKCLILTHSSRVTQICVSKLTTILPVWRQWIIWTNAVILSIGSPATNFNEILIEIHTFSFEKIHLKMSSEKWRPFCLGLNVLRYGPMHVLVAAMICCNKHDKIVVMVYSRFVKFYFFTSRFNRLYLTSSGVGGYFHGDRKLVVELSQFDIVYEQDKLVSHTRIGCGPYHFYREWSQLT